MILDMVLKEEAFTPRGIVHIGANKGQEMERYKEMGVNLLVWIEADEEPFAVLEKKGASGAGGTMQQKFIRALITDKDDETITFHRNTVSDTNSIFEMNNVHRERWPHIVPKETISLTTSRLDTVLTKHDITAGDIDALVIDVQGAELFVLQGSGEYLDAAIYVEVETGKQPHYIGQHHYTDIVEYLSKYSFEPITKIPRNGDLVFKKVRR